MTDVDYLIVGQGIAGTLLARKLLSQGMKVHIIDAGHEGAASAVAAGIINPITGKNFVRSWRIHEFLPFAINEYQSIGKELGREVFRMANILRAITTVEEENHWSARTADPLVNEYMMPFFQLEHYGGKVNEAFSYGELTGTCQVYLPDIIKGYAVRWADAGILTLGQFEHGRLQTQDHRFVYSNISARHLVFCEGHQAAGNPFFPNHGLAPTKGEVLHIKLDGPVPQKMYKDGIFLVPLPDGSLWSGGGYAWNSPDDQPSAAGREKLEEELRRVLRVPFEVVRHEAAIRPTMQSRRPIFLAHEEWKGMYLLNGLGTKGASMGPLIAEEVVSHLMGEYRYTSKLYK
jgi:glycine/D-amino acid oxidase-like deaminating enzyme